MELINERVDQMNDQSISDLYQAALSGDEQTLVRWLATQPDAATILGNILHISALLGHARFVEIILNHNHHLAMREDSSGRTALHLASAEGNLPIVQRLLEFNNDNNELCLVRDEEERIPLYYAAMRGRTEVVKELIKARPKSLRPSDEDLDKITVFHLCVIHNHLETLETLMKLDYAAANIGRQPPSRIFALPDSAGNTILHLAIKFKRFEIVRYLLSIPEIKELKREKNAEGLTAHDILELSPEDEKIKEIKLIWTKDNVEYPETPIWKCIGNCFMKILKWMEHSLKHGVSTNWLEQMRGNLSAASIFIATISFQALINPPGGFIQQGSSSSSQNDTSSSLSPGPLDCTTHNVSLYCPGEAISPVYHQDKFLTYAECITVSFYASLCVTLLLVSGVHLQNSAMIWILSVLMSITLLYLAFAYESAVKIVAPKNDSLTSFSEEVFGLWGVLLFIIMVFYTALSLCLTCCWQ